MTDDEWAYFEPFLIHRGSSQPPRNHRRVLDTVFELMQTGAPVQRDLPEGFGNWNSIFRQFRRWPTVADIMEEAREAKIKHRRLR